MTSVNTGNFQSTRFKLRLGHSILENKGCIHRGNSSTARSVSRWWSSLPPSWPSGLTPQQSACSQATLAAISLLLTCSATCPSLLLGRVVITVNCASVSLPSVQSLSSVSVQPLQPVEKATAVLFSFSKIHQCIQSIHFTFCLC